MNFTFVERRFPPEMTDFIREHYWEVFKGWQGAAAQIYTASLIDNLSARSFIAMEQDARVLGGYRMLVKDWSVQIFDLAVLPAARSKGLGKALIRHAKEKATSMNVTVNGKIFDSPKMFLDTRIYPDKSPFASFLRATGFGGYEPYVLTMGEAEWLAYKLYKSKQQHAMSFRMQIAERSILPAAVKRELVSLTEEQCKIVLDGLDKKLGHFRKSGRLSYKYEVCPICVDIGSTLENPRCGKCYLELGCKTPFCRGFRHDPQVGAMYFDEMRRYLWLQTK
jgi:GNAT superfamily N-acetyltransferase